MASGLIMLIQSAMNQLHVSAYWQYVLTGALTLLAVAIYAQRREGRIQPSLIGLPRGGREGARKEETP